MTSYVMGECDHSSHDTTYYRIREKFIQQAILTPGNRIKRELSDFCRQNIPKAQVLWECRTLAKAAKQATSNTTSCINMVAEDPSSFV